MPNTLDFIGAAATPNVALTAYQAMVVKAGLKCGQHVMINGASGGVGLMAVQLAKSMDCEVTAVCSANNASLVGMLGADKVLDYQRADILAAKQAYDVFFDCVSNQSFIKVRSTLKPAGVHIKTLPGLFSALGVVFKAFGAKRPDHIMVQPSHDHLYTLKNLVDGGQLKPTVHQVFPMSEVAQAHQLSETGRVVGKLVLDMSD